MERHYTTVQAAEILGYSRSCLQKWRTTGRGPRFLKINNFCRYPQSELERWLSQFPPRRSTCDPGDEPTPESSRKPRTRRRRFTQEALDRLAAEGIAPNADVGV